MLIFVKVITADYDILHTLVRTVRHNARGSSKFIPMGKTNETEPRKLDLENLGKGSKVLECKERMQSKMMPVGYDGAESQHNCWLHKVHHITG